MKITKMSLKNKTMRGEDLQVELMFDFKIEDQDEYFELTLDEKDLTNLKNDLQFVYDQFMKFKGE